MKKTLPILFAVFATFITYGQTVNVSPVLCADTANNIYIIDPAVSDISMNIEDATGTLITADWSPVDHLFFASGQNTKYTNLPGGWNFPVYFNTDPYTNPVTGVITEPEDYQTYVYTATDHANPSQSVDITIVTGGFTYDDYCLNSTQTLVDIDLLGIPDSDLTWYDDQAGTIILPNTTPLVGGEIYYVNLGPSFAGCTQVFPVHVEYSIPVPQGNASPDFCSALTWSNLGVPGKTDPTLGDLDFCMLTGATLTFYDAAGNVIPNTTLLQDATTYYVTQTIAGCESAQMAIVPNEEFCACSQNAEMEDYANLGNSYSIYYKNDPGPIASGVCNVNIASINQTSTFGALNSTGDEPAVPVSSGWDPAMLAEGTNPVYFPTTSPLKGCSEYAIRLNSPNDGSYGSGGTDKTAKLTYDFIAGEVFTFDFAAILRAAGHSNSDQPYFKALIVQNGNVIQERCIIANVGGCTFYDLPGAFEPILYSEWSCVKLSTQDILGQPATAVFIVSDCAQSGDFGYAYVDNIYVGPNSGANCDGTFGYVYVESDIPDGDSYETCSEIVVPVNPQCSPAVEALNPVFPITVSGSFKEPESTGNDVSQTSAQLFVYQNGQTTPVLVKNNPFSPGPGLFEFTILQSEIANPYGYFSLEVEMVYDLSCGQNGASSSTQTFSTDSKGFKFCPIAGCASSFSKCSGGSGGPQTFDLTLKGPEILAGIPAAQQSNYKISYYPLLTDAENGTNAILNPATFQTAVTTTVYARLEFDFAALGITPPQEDCFDIVPIGVNIGTAPNVPTTVSSVSGCVGSGNSGNFDLTQAYPDLTVNITNPASTVIVTYHNTFNDADMGINIIATPTNYPGTSGQTIYARVENVSDGCAKVSSFTLSGIQLAYNAPVTLTVCDQDADTLDGSTTVDLGDATAQIAAGYPGLTLTYYASQGDAQGSTSPLPVPGFTTTDTTVWVVIDDGACTVIESFAVDVVDSPEAFPGTLELCDADNDGSGTFTFTPALENTVSGGAAGVTVSFHASQPDADTNTSPITSYTSGSTIIYARVDNGTCHNTSAVTLTLKPSPVLPATVTALELCDDNNPGDQIETFDLTLAEPDLTVNEPVPGDYTVVYYASQANLTANNPITTPTAYANTTAGQQTIYVIVTGSNGCSSQGTFDIIVNPLPTFNAPVDLVECDQGTQDNKTPFDLTVATTQITGTSTSLNISYYDNLPDAQNGTGTPLASPYTNTVPDLQTIYVRIEDTVTGCVDTAPLTLDVIPAPTATAPAPYVLCDLDNSGDEIFNLSSLDAAITGGAAGVVVSYHLTQANAIADTAPLNTSYLSGTATIYARVEETSGAGCFNTVAVDLVLESSPNLPANIPALELCDYNNPGDGAETFDLTLAEPDILALETNPGNFTVAYYASQADLTAGNPIPTANVTAYDNTTPGQQTIWVEVTAGNGLNCTAQMSFDIIVNPLPAFNAPAPLIICDDASANGIATFDLTNATAQITGGAAGLTVTYYETGPQADGGAVADQLPMNYTNTANPYAHTIWVRVEDSATGCYATASLALQVDQAPAAYTPAPLVYCDDDNDGIGTFDLTSLDAVITGGAAGVTVTYHETLANAENDVLAIPNTTAFNNTVFGTQTIYARVESPGVDCFNVVNVVLQVVDSPQAVLAQNLSPLTGCDQDGDGYFSFDLTQMETPILANEPNPSDFTLEYYASQSDLTAGSPIGTPTAYVNTSTPQQTIYVVVTGPNGCTDQTYFEIIVHPLPSITTPVQLELCDVNNPGDQQEAFNLDLAIPGITLGDASIQVTFHQTQAEADSGANPITSPYFNEINNETIYIRAVDGDTGCSVSQDYTLTLIVNPLPSPQIPADPVEVCDADNDGFAEFDLASLEPIIENGEPDVSITFHLTPAEAESGANPIDTSQPYGLVAGSAQTIHVRATNVLTGCYITGQLELMVVPTPAIGSLMDLYVCDDNSPTDGTAVFDLTQNTLLAQGGQLGTQVTYHTTRADAEAGVNAIVFPASYTNLSNGQVIYVRLENTATGCIDTFDSVNDNSFTLNVEALPIVNDPSPLQLCDDDYNTVPVPQVEFDLTVKEGEIVGLAFPPNHYVFTYYASQADMDNDVPIADPTAYVNTSNPQEIHVRVVDTTTEGQCADHTTITLVVLPLPSPSETDLEVLRLEQCDDDNDGVAADPFDLTQSGLLIAGGENVVLSYYKTEYAAETGDTASPEYIADPVNYVNEPAYNEVNAQGMVVQVIYARVDSGVAGNFCYVVVPFEIRVVPAPELNPIVPFGYTLCEDGNTGSAELFTGDIAHNLYDASVASPDPSVLVPLLDPSANQDQDLNNHTIFYYPTQQDADAGTNAIGTGYMASTGDRLYVVVVNNDTGCASEAGEILITVEPRPAITEIHVFEEVCSDEPGGSTATVDLTVYDAQINPGAPAGTEVVYYANQNAYTNGQPIATPGAYTTIEDPQTIVGVVMNTQNLCESATYATIEIDVEMSPMIDLSPYDGMIICEDANPLTPVEGGNYAPIVIDTGLDATAYSFEWSLGGTVLAETGPSLEVAQAGTYQLTVTNNATGCQSTDSATIIESNPPEFEVEVLTRSFSEEHTITITNVTGAGDYEFSVDQGPWMALGQDGTLTFTGIGAGVHRVYGRDKNGCGTTLVEVSIIDYPKFFTPNGDGYNDTWNIIGISDQPNAQIYIFDRYGKLLKQLSPTGPGWDGTYNGRPMPSSDYWFRVEYIEPMTATPATFKANFTLKR